MFQFNVENTGNSQASNDNRPKVDWDALNQHVIDAAGTQNESKAEIGIISGIIDLGLQVQEDAKMEWKGDASSEAEELDKNPEQYFETLPNDKGVPTRYKRWKVKPCQQVAITVDFPSIMVNKGQFFGDENAKPLPLRMLLNGEFYIKDIGKVVGKPYNIKEVKQDDGSWAFKNNTQLHKLAAATGVLNEQGRFKPHMLGNLIGKAALFDIQVFLKKGTDGKSYFNENIKLSGKIPQIMIPMIPEIDQSLLFGVNFKGKQDPAVLKNLRQSVINTMKQAVNFEGSDIQKALSEGGNSGNAQPKKETKAEQKAEQPNTKEAEQSFDAFEDSEDLPF